jgi:hypothetical protein
MSMSKEQMKAMRKKYHLGEFKKGVKSKSTDKPSGKKEKRV